MARVLHEGSLLPEEAYVVEFQGYLPGSLSGSYYLMVAVDALDQVCEGEDIHENLVFPAVRLMVAPQPFVDLAVTQVSAPAVGAGGQGLDLQWQVSNTDNAWTSMSAAWILDLVCLSPDAVFGDGK